MLVCIIWQRTQAPLYYFHGNNNRICDLVEKARKLKSLDKIMGVCTYNYIHTNDFFFKLQVLIHVI